MGFNSGFKVLISSLLLVSLPDVAANKTNCEDRMFGNSVWRLCWQIYGFISVKEFATFGYAVGSLFATEISA
jgi:phage tail protein X